LAPHGLTEDEHREFLRWCNTPVGRPYPVTDRVWGAIEDVATQLKWPTPQRTK